MMDPLLLQLRHRKNKMISRLNKHLVNLLNLPELIFVVIAFIFGVIFLFITPPSCVPDEVTHMFRSCDVAVGSFLSETRPEIKPYDETMLSAISGKVNDIDKPFAMRYSPVMYIFSAIGVKLGHILSLDALSIFYLGRFLNLLFYIFLISTAISITPVFKYPFMFIGLLPMSLFMGMSYNADSFCIAFVLFSFAYLFKLIFSEKEVSGKQLSAFVLISCIGALAKGLIYPMFLSFFIPIKKHKKKILFILISLILIVFYYSSTMLNFINLNPTCDVINDKTYVFTHSFEVLQSILLTTREKGYAYIHQLIGYLGWLSIPIPETTCNRIILIFFIMLFVLSEKVKASIKIFSGLLLIFFYIFILYFELITWTPVGETIIQGVQGRYFIPLLPFFLLAFPSIKLKVSERIKNLFKIFLIFMLINLLYTAVIGLHVYYYELNINNFM